MGNKYDTSSNVENQYEPGSDNKVMKNILGITDPDFMAALEFKLLLETKRYLQDTIKDDYCFKAKDIYLIHKRWLGGVYEWAGKARSVFISKGDIAFCAPKYIEQAMSKFEREQLAKYTPCTFDTIDEIATAMAVVHAEFEIIHPFREGNGRLGRLLATLMANQSGFAVEELDSYIKDNWEIYLQGLSDSWDKNYKILTEIFKKILYQE